MKSTALVCLTLFASAHFTLAGQSSFRRASREASIQVEQPSPMALHSIAGNETKAIKLKNLCKPFHALPPSNCYASPWLQELHQVDPAPEKVFVDVGCNTGVEAVNWLDLWEMNGLTEKWRSALSTTGINAGACGQNTVTNMAAATSFVKPALTKGKVLCIEAMKVNADLLNSVNNAVFGQNSPVEVIYKAASDRLGTVDFPANGTGAEHRGINNLMNIGNDIHVDMTTVDTLVAERGISRVDVLTVDTEGHDPAVLRGAKQTLLNTRFVQFEVHEDLATTEWGRSTMLNVLTELGNVGFDCYWPGNDGSLLKLTGCWSQTEQSRYHPLGWSNVVCAKRSDAFHSVLEKWCYQPPM